MALNSALAPERVLHKKLPNKPSAVLSGYFRKLQAQIKGRRMEAKQFIDTISEGKSELTFEELSKALNEMRFMFVANELTSVFDLLAKDGKISTQEIFERLGKFSSESNSDRSSDISSPRSNNSHSELVYVSGTEIPENLKEEIELLSVIVRTISKEEFVGRLMQFPDSVRFDDLNKLFLERPYRIEDCLLYTSPSPRDS